MFTFDMLPWAATGALEPVPLRTVNAAFPFEPGVRVHWTVIHLPRSGARSHDAMSGEPELAYARARNVSLLPLRPRSNVTHGPPLVSGVLVWKMWVNLLVPCRDVGMYIS